MSQLQEVIIAELRVEWTSLGDLVNTVRMRKRTTYYAVIGALRELVKRGAIERRGAKWSIEYRLPSVVA